MARPGISHPHALKIIEWDYEPSEGRTGNKTGRKLLMVAGALSTHSISAPDPVLCGIEAYSQSQTELSMQLPFALWTLYEPYEIAQSTRGP